MSDLHSASSEFSDSSIFEEFLSGAKTVYDRANQIIGDNEYILETAKYFQMVEESYGNSKKTYESIGQDKTAVQWLEDYTDAIEKYNDALLLDDGGKIADAKSEFEALDSAIQDLIANNPDFAFFASMFEDVRAALNDSAISAHDFGNCQNDYDKRRKTFN